MEVSKKDIDLLIQDKYEGSTENKHLLRRDLARLAVGEPLAYVIGWVPFLGLKIYLDSRPLIPRPETEWWTEELIKARTESNTIYGINGSKGSLRVLDLCAGSGAIGCAMLKSIPDARVSFGEVTPAHEATIRKNIEENNLDAARADIRIGDLFAPFAGETFDVIATNPPYIPTERVLEENVIGFEPHEALLGGDDGLAIIRRIARDAEAHINEGGMLWLECDTEHAEAARELITKGGVKKAEIRTDPYGRPRIIVGYY